MKSRSIALLSAAALTLAACSFGGQQQNRQPTPPPQPALSEPSASESLAVPPAGSEGDAVRNRDVTGTVTEQNGGLTISDQPNSQGSYPYGTPQGESEGVLIEGADGQLYSPRDPKSQEQYQSDVAACFYYAQALIEHDAQIEQDRSGSFDDDFGSGSSLRNLQSSINRQEEPKRRNKHFRRCMESKGYYQR